VINKMWISTPALVALVVAIIIETVCNVEAKFNGEYVRQPSSCVSIPTDLKLCYGVGYDKMVLPNLLNHESMEEVYQQALSFVPLIRKNCHPLLRIFLCSLFAPVCLEDDSAVRGPIPPCKTLCVSVENSCAPVMQLHGFDWPAMLNCSKFDNVDPCVSVNETMSEPVKAPAPSKPSKNKKETCAPCSITLQKETLLEDFCASEFVLKIRIRKVKVINAKQVKGHKAGIRQIFASKKKPKRNDVFKRGPLENKDLKRLKLHLTGGPECKCPQLDTQGGGKKQKGKKKKKGKSKKSLQVLVMGRKTGQKLVVTVIHPWEKNKTLKKLSDPEFISKCPTFGVPVSGRR